MSQVWGGGKGTAKYLYQNILTKALKATAKICQVCVFKADRKLKVRPSFRFYT